ncbi:hypothetical protein GOP47_0011815 [Adiantum capillus-veneris]|uniref:Uncharacterized protein n=1 Tax=Adiantum capillus-veneris TaxID=13818 RepID=A0A9D4UTX9_ADICA|nr:hypothetical protein GOP47_0011815 [Adiantum capillus-veneris]
MAALFTRRAGSLQKNMRLGPLAEGQHEQRKLPNLLQSCTALVRMRLARMHTYTCHQHTGSGFRKLYMWCIHTYTAEFAGGWVITSIGNPEVKCAAV